MKNSLDKAFKDKLEHGTASYPEDLWDKIEAQLPAPKDKAPNALFGKLGLALVFAAIALSLYFMKDNAMETQVSQNLHIDQNKQTNTSYIIDSSEDTKEASALHTTEQDVVIQDQNAKFSSPTLSNTNRSLDVAQEVPFVNTESKNLSLDNETDLSSNTIKTNYELPVRDLKASSNYNYEANVRNVAVTNESIANTISRTSGIHSTASNASTRVISNNSISKFNTRSISELITVLKRKEIAPVNNLRSNRRRYNAKRLLTECPAFVITGGKGIILDFYFSPDFAMRDFNARGTEFSTYSTERENSENAYLSYSAGMRVSWVNKSGLALRSGINFTQINEVFKYLNTNVTGIDTIIKIQNGSNVRDTTFVEIGETIDIKTHNRYRSIDVPFLVGLEMPFNKNIKMSINAGVFVNLMFQQKGRYIDQQGHPNWFVGQNLYKTSLGLSYYGSLGLNYIISPRMDFMIEPNLRKYSQSFTVNDYPLTQEYLKFGLLTGIRYHF